jgi:beta-glucosidase-like glycosyl hydrolase
MTLPIIFGINSTRLSKEEIDLFTTYPVAGFILFARNIESKTQLLELTASLKNLYPSRKVPIFVDQEGGRVARIKPPVAARLYPSAEHFSNIYEKDRLEAKRELKANYIELMSELKNFGIDSPCAPVCDLSFKGAHDVIGDRSFGDNPEKVIDLCKSAIAGIRHAGGLAFIKHIPGHGRAIVDSHFDLPIVDTPLEELEATDFRVFRELAAETELAMTAHIIYTAIDPLQPATTSKPVINYIRNNIGFKGKIMTDDLGMYALHGEVGKKRSTLKKVIKLAEGNLEWKTDFAESLMTLFDINTDQITNLAVIELCKKKLAESKVEFFVSLAKMSRMSLAAGCDFVLHCSGDIDEMRAICNC